MAKARKACGDHTTTVKAGRGGTGRDRAGRKLVRRGADGPIQAGAMARQITHITSAMPVSVITNIV